jgi:selenocysteine lyase/cysteine desulfurase
MRGALHAWQTGAGNWRDDWDRLGDVCRQRFAALIGAPVETVALIPAASVGVGLVAAALRAGDRVVVPDDEFTSVLYPLLVAEREGRAAVRRVPFGELAGAIDGSTRLVAFSLVQSQSGRAADLAGVCAAARAAGAQTLVDATQALPFVPVAGALPAIDYLVCAAYKHLLCPRGVAFVYVNRDRWDALSPLFAGWRAADHPYERYYGGPLALAPTAARFDVSLAWLPWVGAAASLGLLCAWQQTGALAAPQRLAARLAREVGVPPPAASIVSVPVRDAAAAGRALDARAIRASVRAGAVRLAPHVYNTVRDILLAARTLAPHRV